MVIRRPSPPKPIYQPDLVAGYLVIGLAVMNFLVYCLLGLAFLSWISAAPPKPSEAISPQEVSNVKGALGGFVALYLAISVGGILGGYGVTKSHKWGFLVLLPAAAGVIVAEGVPSVKDLLQPIVFIAVIVYSLGRLNGLIGEKPT